MDYNETKMEKFTVSDGCELDIHIWGSDAPEAVILAIHGGMSHAGDYVQLGSYFAEHDITTVSYDLRGHKRKRSHVDSFDHFLGDTDEFFSWVAGRFPGKPVFIVGHSTGANIAMLSGLTTWKNKELIKGYVISSPSFENAIKVPEILLKISKILSKVIPKGKVPMEDMTPVLTHDEEIYKRHREDEKKNIRGTESSIRSGMELLRSDEMMKEMISGWSRPVYIIVAGQDKLINTEATMEYVQKISPEHLTLSVEKENYHENFNELNRNDIFGRIHSWMKQRL